MPLLGTTVDPMMLGKIFPRCFNFGDARCALNWALSNDLRVDDGHVICRPDIPVGVIS